MLTLCRVLSAYLEEFNELSHSHVSFSRHEGISTNTKLLFSILMCQGHFKLLLDRGWHNRGWHNELEHTDL